jgi:hypothetical protein
VPESVDLSHRQPAPTRPNGFMIVVDFRQLRPETNHDHGVGPDSATIMVA